MRASLVFVLVLLAMPGLAFAERADESGANGGGPPAPRPPWGLWRPTWRFWWAYNQDEFLDLKAHIYAPGEVRPGTLGWQSPESLRARRARRPMQRAIVQKINPALMRSLNRADEDDEVRAQALLALGLTGTTDYIPLLEAVARGRSRTDRGKPIASSDRAEDAAVLALGLLPKLDAHGKSFVRKVLLDIIDDTSVRTRTRAWAAVGLGLQRDDAATAPLWERLARERAGDDDETIPAAVLCGLGLIGDESVRLRLEALLESGAVGARTFSDPTLAYAAVALARLANPKSLPTLLAVLQDRDAAVPRRRATAIAIGRCGAEAEPELRREAVDVLRRYVANPRGDLTGTGHAIVALGRIGTEEAVESLLALTREGLYEQRPFAMLALGAHAQSRSEGPERIAPDRLERIRRALATASTSCKDDSTRSAAMLARGLCRDETLREECLAVAARDGPSHLRGSCCLALGLLGDRAEGTRTALQRVLRGTENPDVGVDAARALTMLHDDDRLPILVEKLNASTSVADQIGSIRAMGITGDQQVVDRLIDVLDDRTRPAPVRAAAAASLGRLGDLLPVSQLARLSADYDYGTWVEELEELLRLR